MNGCPIMEIYTLISEELKNSESLQLSGNIELLTV